MRYVYPVIFKEEDGKFLATIPDLPGCHTFGNDLADAIEMARDAVSLWLCIAEDKQEEVPQPSKTLDPVDGFVSFVDIDTNEYRRLTDNRAVKKTLSIPSWLNAKAERAGVNFSAILQEALKQQLHLE